MDAFAAYQSVLDLRQALDEEGNRSDAEDLDLYLDMLGSAWDDIDLLLMQNIEAVCVVARTELPNNHRVITSRFDFQPWWCDQSRRIEREYELKILHDTNTFSSRDRREAFDKIHRKRLGLERK